MDVPQDGAAVAADLRALLEAAGEAPPFVLVGHSLGGSYVRLLADAVPEQVAGVVLLDARHPDLPARAPELDAQFEPYRRVQSLFPLLARVGVWRAYFDAGGQFDVGGLPPGPRAQMAAIWSGTALHRSQRDENAVVERVDAQARALGDLGNRPLAVVSAGEQREAWMRLQEDLAELSTDSVHRTLPGASHTSLVTDQQHAGAVADAVLEVVDAVRTGRGSP